ncbi:MAG: tRNA (adenosine(37)-N6)-threonylcarbamoyltransferase complex dimerization subunit type 1 TsaB [Deltaproteobacteria bacterium]|nr:tRNA (adenosine(37)-N6)-threonylcarbamoyltransferase complex dimerization subunit type 1 TsaB [Deltaproteobacteria bacterium]MBW1937754.1 tRNA (adenosine(37)-N6)-threonylcarbamoyltransferase complex dimerization subunit type 1 TsaB [Deltaproteobacteria bacterium]
MVTLSIETSDCVGGVALIRDGRPVAEVGLASKETHSRRLIVIIKWLMQRLGLDWSDLGLLAVSLGPGSFTGLRIGLSTAKGLAFALGLPLIGVPTLDALASHVIACKGDFVCPVLDARKSQVYTALYQIRTSGELEKISPYQVIFPEELAAFVPYGQKVLLLGGGLLLYQDIFVRGLGDRAVIVPSHMSHLRAASVGILAELMWQKDSKPDDFKTLKPIYVRPSEAEAKKPALQE